SMRRGHRRDYSAQQMFIRNAAEPSVTGTATGYHIQEMMPFMAMSSFKQEPSAPVVCRADPEEWTADAKSAVSAWCRQGRRITAIFRAGEGAQRPPRFLEPHDK